MGGESILRVRECDLVLTRVPACCETCGEALHIPWGSWPLPEDAAGLEELRTSPPQVGATSAHPDLY